MRILFLDDDPARTDIFLAQAAECGHEVDAVATAEAAIAGLRGVPYDMVFLDHDLEHQPFADPASSNTGSEVCRYLQGILAANPKALLRTQIILHSNNPIGVANMFALLGHPWFAMTLGNYGRVNVIAAPFGSWTLGKDGIVVHRPSEHDIRAWEAR